MGATRRSWVVRSLVVAAVVLVVWMNWCTDTLSERVVRDTVLYLFVPLGLGLSHGRRLGWRIDQGAIRDTVVLALFVVPFYLIGSTLPTVRAFYPIWPTAPRLGVFIPHAIQLFVLALATETYFRGLLCVGVRELGAKCVLISPLVYALIHVNKPPIELLLSGPTDVLFGAVDYHADSILPSVVAHGGGLVLLDWLVLHEPITAPDRVIRWLSWIPVPL